MTSWRTQSIRCGTGWILPAWHCRYMAQNALKGTVALSHPDAAPQEDFLCSVKPVTLVSLGQAASGRTRAAWGEARGLWIEDLAATP